MERGPGWRGRWSPRPPAPWPTGGREGLGPGRPRWWTARGRSPHGSSSRPRKDRAAPGATASPTGSWRGYHSRRITLEQADGYDSAGHDEESLGWDIEPR